MEIQIQLAGVQLGPYSEKQVRRFLSEGLLFPADPAREAGTENWIAVNVLLSKPAATTVTLPRPAFGEVSEAPKRAPDAPPGVVHLPPRRQDSSTAPLPPETGDLDKKTIPIGPVAPSVPSSSGRMAASTATTAPLAPARQDTKKVSRASLAEALARKTSPLPTKAIVPSSGPLSSPAPTVPAASTPAQQDVRKTSLAPLARALSTKTTPMRSVSAPPAPPGGRPMTAPLPTKPIFKPASGTIPPPPVGDAPGKKPGQSAPPDSGKAPPATLDLRKEVATTRITPSTTKTARSPDEPADKPFAPVPDDSADEPFAPSRLFPALICASAVLALLTSCYVWSPYHAASSLRNALDDGDRAKLAAAIDFPSVRASLKEQIKNQIAPSGLRDAKSDSSPGLASSTLLSTLDQSIDLYITPEGISGLVKKSGTFPNAYQPESVSPEVAAKVLMAFEGQPVRNRGLASFDDFVIERDAALLHLRLQGMGWKLKRIDLRPDLPLLFPVVDTYLERGDAESKAGAWDGAITDFTRVLAIDPRSSAAYGGRGAARQAEGDLEGAIKDYTQALAIDPQMAADYQARANAKNASHDLEGAIADYTQALALDPALAAAYDGRGNAKISQNDLDGAIADFTRAIAIEPTRASTYSDRGFARQANGNLEGAIDDYTESLALKPGAAIVYYNRGLAQQSQGKFEAAIADYTQALALDPKLAGAYFNRGNARNANHDLDGAIADYTQAVALKPKLAPAYCKRGQARQAKGDLEGAVADYTQALAIDPKLAIAYYDRGLIKAQENDLDGAIADNSQALDLDPKNVLAYYERGLAKLAKGNLDGALADLKQFCGLAPQDHNADYARLYFWLISKAQNPKADADQDLSIALENSWNSPSDDLASRTAAFLLGRIDEADYLAALASTDAKTDQGQHCEAWYFAGMKRLLAGDKKAAIDAFHQCLATGQATYCEYVLARAELQALEPAPPTNPATGAVPAPAATGTAPAKSP